MKTLKAVEQMVALYSEICFHECVFPEAGFEPQDLVVYCPGPLLVPPSVPLHPGCSSSSLGRL